MSELAITKSLERALQLKAELDALRPLASDQEQRVWQKFRFDWNYHSNNIEGNSLTFGETKTLLLHNITAQGKPLKDHIEITGHNEAIDALLDVARGNAEVTESFVRALHKMILHERYQVAAQTPEGAATKKWIEVGQYKTSPNHVITVTGELFRFAEPIDVPAKMHALLYEVNAVPSGSGAKALVAAAKAHYDLVLIHPFDDGNGRMARLLMNLLLIKHGFPPAIVRTEDKANYFAALRQADGGKLAVFVEYIASCVVRSLEIMLAGVRGENIEEEGEQDRQIKMLERLLENKVGSVTAKRTSNDVREVYERSFVPLLQSFEVASSLFKGFYSSLDTQIFAHRDLLPTAAGLAECAAKISQDDTDWVMYTSFHNLKFQGMEHHTHIWHVQLDLNPATYSVQFKQGDVRVTKSYGQPLSVTEIEELIAKAKKEHIGVIERLTGITLADM